MDTDLVYSTATANSVYFVLSGEEKTSMLRIIHKDIKHIFVNKLERTLFTLKNYKTHVFVLGRCRKQHNRSEAAGTSIVSVHKKSRYVVFQGNWLSK